jgi:RHS repeat-associated protein
VQVYGEDKPSPSATNHVGRPWKAYDGAGLVEVGAYDFKGNPLWKERRVVSDDEVLSVFDPPPPNWNVQSWVIDWTGLPAREAILEAAVHRTDMVYDGLNRPTSVTLPADAVGTRSVLEPSYNRAGAVESLSLDGTAHIRHIAYNARGQRVLAAFGNGVMTRHAYHPVNFRLLRQRSEPYAHPPGGGQPHTYAFQGGVRQDTAYHYDLAGNITAMVDASPDAGVGGAGALQRDFGYDALYRLLRATGRESGAYATSPDPWTEPHVPDQGVAGTRAYTRTYTYDALGNLLRLRNAATGNTWDRWYNNAATAGQAAYAGSNLLTSVTYGATTIQSQYDACGNLVQEGAARFLEWDAADQLRSFRTQTPGSEPSEYAHYLYDAGGDRVKKVVRKQGGVAVVSVYLGGVEHHYELRPGGVRGQEFSETHVMDGRSRVAVLKAFGASWTGSVDDVLRYNLEDHLGNACFLLDGSGGLVSREEYFPFGETSFCLFGKQRYRFCGKERDEESGLYYYGARYYAAWCCRFVSVDPLAAKYPFYTPYQYAGNQPIISVDIDGLEGDNPNNSQKPTSSRMQHADVSTNAAGKIETGVSIPATDNLGTVLEPGYYTEGKSKGGPDQSLNGQAVSYVITGSVYASNSAPQAAPFILIGTAVFVGLYSELTDTRPLFPLKTYNPYEVITNRPADRVIDQPITAPKPAPDTIELPAPIRPTLDDESDKIRIALGDATTLSEFAKETKAIPYTSWADDKVLPETVKDATQGQINGGNLSVFKDVLQTMVDDERYVFVFNRTTTTLNPEYDKEIKTNPYAEMYVKLTIANTLGSSSVLSWEYRMVKQIVNSGRIKFYERVSTGVYKNSKYE